MVIPQIINNNTIAIIKIVEIILSIIDIAVSSFIYTSRHNFHNLGKWGIDLYTT